MPMDLQYRNPGNRALLDLLDIPPGRVLDCGCGAGDNARLLRQQGWQVTGVTLDPAELVAATAECVATELADLSAGLPFAADGSFDLVLLSHILEHLVDPAALIAEARRVLAPGGRIAIALPNVAHFRQRALHLLGRFEYTETGVMDSTHVRFFTVETARRLLETNGLAIVASDASGGLPWWRGRRLLPRELVARADRWALANRPNLFAWQAVFLTVPTGGPVPVVEQRSRRHTEESARPVPTAPPGRVSPGPSSG
ncbi:class I SAM-dependent methyltransferase [Frankia sp. Mgl5]|uniref:class I SAM-dependent methyltransferase n=1 Tax=Frankia sp. Mgl5 TaxID=2933793 RepID=UPI002010B13D|nr:class I SAM-dependent methyltransferase [Frankia sp. Mgl5]MCK9932320.1 class I SAM-dependent methyltransferase [Frankia sp. Mgl5]